MTLKSRIQNFWGWFIKYRKTMEKDLDNDRAEQVAAIIGTHLERLGLSILCEVGKEDGKYIISLSPCGDKTRQFISRYWAQMAPKVRNWTFRPFRRPVETIGQELSRLIQRECNPDEFTVYCVVDEELQRYHVHVVSPVLDPYKGYGVPLCRMIFYLLLGEAYTDVYIGKIRCSGKEPDPVPPGKKMTLAQFCDMVRNTSLERAWACVLDPTSLCFGYQDEENNGGDGMREDIYGGFTNHLKLKNEPASEASALLDMGGVFCYFYYDAERIPPPKLAEQQALLTGKIEQMLNAYKLGYVVGSAQGTDFCYIDLIIFDEPEFRAVCRDIAWIVGHPLNLEYFGRTPSGEYIQ